MVSIQSISSGGYLITAQNGRTTYCATFNDLVTQLQILYGTQNSAS